MTDPVPSQPKGFFASIRAWQHRRKRRRKEKTRALMEKYREVLRQRAINPPPKGFFPKVRAIFAKIRAIFAKMRENEKQRKARGKKKYDEKQRKINERYKRKQRYLHRNTTILPRIEETIKGLAKDKRNPVVFFKIFFWSSPCMFFVSHLVSRLFNAAMDPISSVFLGLTVGLALANFMYFMTLYELKKLRKRRDKMWKERCDRKRKEKQDSKPQDEQSSPYLFEDM